MNAPDQSPTDAAIPTPRTDSHKQRTSVCLNWDNTGDHHREVIPADFARQLERESTQWKETAEKDRDENVDLRNDLAQSRRELDTLRAQLAQAERERDDYHRKACEIADQRDKAEAKVEAMREAHERFTTDSAGVRPNTWHLGFVGGYCEVRIERDKESGEPVADIYTLDLRRVLLPAVEELERRIAALTPGAGERTTL